MNSTPPHPAHSSRLQPAVVLAAAALLACYLLLVSSAVDEVGQTADEGNYVTAGRVILNEGAWNHVFFTNAQGPITLYLGQLFLAGADLDDISTEELARARLGTLPLGALLAVLVFCWSLRLHGPRGALLSLGMFALTPMTIAYGTLFTVDLTLSAFVTLFCWAAWEYLRRPTLGKLALMGAALGLACGTKYIALLYCPLGAVLALVPVLRAGQPNLRRALHAAGVVILLTAVTLFTLHACYGFQPGFSSTDPALYVSEKVRGLVTSPTTRPLVRLLPQAFTAGIDYQVNWSEGGHLPYLNGRFAPGHWDYYLWAVLLKTPEVLLLLAGIWIVRCLPAILRRPERGQERAAAGIVLVVIGVPLAYFSLLTTAQVGIRYVLPAFPLAFVLFGALAHLAGVRALSHGARVAAALALAAVLAADCWAYWPNLSAYYNRLGGGQAHAYRHFTDTNSDWNQLRDAGPELLRGRGAGPFTVLTARDGPRFGRVAIYVTSLSRRDPLDASRSHHWLDAFEPVEHIDAAWWVFDVTRADFEAAYESTGDERVGAELAVALLAEGELEASGELLAGLPIESATAPRTVLGLLSRAAPPDAVPHARQLGQAWLALDRPDRVVELLDHPNASLDASSSELLANAFYAEERWPDVIRVLAPREDLGEHPGPLLLLADTYRRTRDHDQAIALLRTHLDRVAPAVRPRIETVLDFFVRRRDGMAAIRATLRRD